MIRHVLLTEHTGHLSIHQAGGHLIVKVRETQRPRDIILNSSSISEIFHAILQHCCRGACPISERYDNYNETKEDMAVECYTTLQEIPLIVQNLVIKVIEVFNFRFDE